MVACVQPTDNVAHSALKLTICNLTRHCGAGGKWPRSDIWGLFGNVTDVGVCTLSLLQICSERYKKARNLMSSVWSRVDISVVYVLGQMPFIYFE